MSHENVEIVRRHLEALRRRDPRLRSLEFMREDVEFDASTRPDGKVWHGHDGAREALGEWLEIWDEYELRFGDVLDAVSGHGRLAVAARAAAPGRAALSSPRTGATVFTLADGEHHDTCW